MNFESLNNMVPWERQKAMYLIECADELGMDTDGYGEVNVNQNSGYTYLWLEDYDFCLYMPIHCDLKKSDVYVMWTNMNTGEEIEKELSSFYSLDDIYDWTRKLYDKSNEEE